MGLALDEPKEGDESYQVDGLQLVVDPFAMRIVRESGGMNIKHTLFGPVAELQSSSGAGCNC